MSKKLDDDSTLPKDFYERPVSENSRKYDEVALDKLKIEILNLIAKEKCNDVQEWSFSSLGIKPCGGAASYIAYPLVLENTILPKIQNYNELQDEFNKKYELTSDCNVERVPTGVRCQKGHPVLVY